MLSFKLVLLTILVNFSTIITADVRFLPYGNASRIKRQADCREFQCASGECISSDLECDGAINCKDGSDETFACRNIPCQPYLFRCAYGACINGDSECDGKPDCKDNSDENTSKCKSTTTPQPEFDCGAGNFTCKSKQCVDELDLCDGIKNCDDGSDETLEACFQMKCPSFTYKCAYGGCVDGNARCNGKMDCVDNSDEAGCLNVVTTTTVAPTTTTTEKAKNPNFCVLPNQLTNGRINLSGDTTSIYQPGKEVPPWSTIAFTCNPHHLLTSTNTNVSFCYNGAWSPEIPKCESACRPLSNTEQMKVKCDKSGSVVECERPFHGTRVRAECVAPYEDRTLTHPSSICRFGKWVGHMPNCVPECGLKFINAQTLIIGGTIAKEDHWPWVVGVYHGESKTHICGGSIISPGTVISAAHCFTDESSRLLPIENYKIAAGKHYRLYDHIKDVNAQYSDVKQISIPEDYQGDVQNYRADIAVVILTTQFKLTNNVRPVCINNIFDIINYPLQFEEKGLVLGWGLTVEGSTPSDELKELDVPYYPLDDCKQNLPKNFTRFATTGDKMCGGYINQATSVCQGDSGGGYLFQKEDRYYLRGVVSVSPKSPSGSCDSNLYTLFTNMSKYLDFITNVQINEI